jgi:hypothetical protein
MWASNRGAAAVRYLLKLRPLSLRGAASDVAAAGFSRTLHQSARVVLLTATTLMCNRSCHLTCARLLSCCKRCLLLGLISCLRCFRSFDSRNLCCGRRRVSQLCLMVLLQDEVHKVLVLNSHIDAVLRHSCSRRSSFERIEYAGSALNCIAKQLIRKTVLGTVHKAQYEETPKEQCLCPSSEMSIVPGTASVLTPRPQQGRVVPMVATPPTRPALGDVALSPLAALHPETRGAREWSLLVQSVAVLVSATQSSRSSQRIKPTSESSE